MRRPGSLAARLALWYAGSAYLLLLAATGFLYWALLVSLDAEDDQVVRAKFDQVLAILAEHPNDRAALRREIDGEGRPWPAPLLRVRLLGPDGATALESPGLGAALPADLLPLPPAGVSAIREVEGPAGQGFRGLAARLEGGPYAGVQVAFDQSHEEALIAGYRNALWVVLALGVALCGGGGFLLARAGLRPLTAITRAARRIRSTTLHERLAAAALPAELRDLALTFNAMLDRLQDAFTRLSQFSADLAHELRTPVNNLRGEVEVALGQERTPEEYRHVLHSCLEECGRLAALIDTLLFLARAESPATVIARRPVDVAAELRAVRDFFEAAAHEAGVALVVPTAGPVPADADPVLLQRAVVNLVANALRHTPAGGTVTLTTAAEDGRVRITVADTGRGIAAEHLPRLFDRFYRVDAARSADAGGVGLGLALVKGIARLHGGEVNVTSTPGQGACFTLMIPTGVRDLGR